MPKVDDGTFWQTTDGETVRLFQGDVLAVLRNLPARSVQCIVTSPPYWGLRSYLSDGHKDKHKELGSEDRPDCLGWARGENCAEACWETGCYICRMVLVCRELRRVLRDDGTLWLNYGDTYSAGKTGRDDNDPVTRANLDQHGHGGGVKLQATGNNGIQRRLVRPQGSTSQRQGRSNIREQRGNAKAGLPSGNLVGVPWRVALALQADGWTLRQDIIWHKPAPMPECLDPETQVFIRVNGWVSRITLDRLYKMSVKPEILGPNGWVKVLNLWKVRKPAMILEAGKVERVICSPDHKFPVSHDRSNLRTEDKPASEIRAVGYRDYLLYCPIQKYLSPTLTEWGGVGLTGYLGYVLGLYAAEGSQDGGYRMKWTIHREEHYIKSKFFKSLVSLGLDGQAFPDPDSNAQNLIATSDWLQRTIWTFVFGKDARTKRLNIELMLNAPEDFRSRFLEGYVDGDGSDRGEGWGASSASRGLRNDISTLASSLGIITSKGYSKGSLKGSDKEYHSHGIWTPYFNRSTKKGTDGIYQILPRGRKELGEERDMIDIEVEGQLFLIGDGLVSHNSVKNRCTKAHEYVFLLTKGMRYFYDAEAIKEPSSNSSIKRMASGYNTKNIRNGIDDPKVCRLNADEEITNSSAARLVESGLANKRSVWTVSQPLLKLRDDLTPEQKNYVLRELVTRGLL